MKLDESDLGTRYGLYYIHNRRHRGQIVLVWFNGKYYRFTLHDELHPESNFPADSGDWVCIGELEWQVADGKFAHEIFPLQRR